MTIMSRFYLFFIPLVFFAESALQASTSFHRIISLSPLATEEVFLLGRDSELIADTIYCIHPEEAKVKPKIGTIIDINIEKIFQLKPDLVLSSGLTDPKKLDKLRDLKIRVEVFVQPENFQAICDQFMRLAVLLERENSAKYIMHEAQYRVSNLRTAAAIYTKKRVFVQIGSNPLFTVSRNSFINDYIVFGNGINIAADSGSGLYSLEAVIKNDPEVIILSDMGMDIDNEKKFWQKYKSISAVKKSAVYSIDSYHLCSPTPATFASTLKDIIHMIHPEFKEMSSK